MLDANEKKRLAAEAALTHVEDGMILGIGTGSTVNRFIAALKDRKIRLEGAVSSSRATSELLKTAGIAELELNFAGDLPLYVDGADEATPQGQLIKGGGAALTREKIIAAASKRFVASSTTANWSMSSVNFPSPWKSFPWRARTWRAKSWRSAGSRCGATGSSPTTAM